MTSRSPKKPPTTQRSTLQILCEHIRPAAALGASGLLGLVIAGFGPNLVDAAVRDIVTKPGTATRATSAATKTAKATAQRSQSASRTGEKSPRSNIRLVAQSETPLDRLRQRDPEQRLRSELEESPLNFSGFIQPDSPTNDLELPEPKKSKSPRSDNEDSPSQPESKRDSSPFEDAPPTRPQGADAPAPLPMPDSSAEPISSPVHLKKISEIQPYYDYQPSSALKGDVCWDLCPRPDGKDCQADPETGLVPECPHEHKLADQAYIARTFGDCLYQWQASDLYHNPLYFEDWALERYGHTHNCLLQPFMSVGKFGLQLAGLPYQMSIDPVRKKMYTLGYYRPGECAPKKYYRIPWNTHAAVAEAGVWTGLIFIFP